MAVDVNMYGLKYQFSRTSTNGADILITIHKKWYEGEVITRALGRAPVIKRENKDHIYGTSCELYLECKVDGEFAEMYTSDPYEYRVAVYKNGVLLWMGFVSPELYSEPDVAPPYDVQVIATDGLGELKNFDFGKRGTTSILSHINYLMSKSGIGVPLNIVSDLRFSDAAGTTSAAKDILNVKVNLDHEANSSCYEALQSLLSSLNANITQINGSYLIFRETDFIVKAQETGVEAFDVNGNSLNLPVAKFGSMRTHQWWPVGQLSSVIEPAKNKLTLKAPDHYKDNVLDFESWSLIDASYLDNEGAYSLPNKNSAITQSLDFGGQEVGYRLGLRVRARNVGAGQYGGTSDKAQNLGLKVEMEGRAFADYLGPKFWLIKSEGISSGYALSDYMWKSNEENSVEEELRNPSSADSAADAQNIDIVLPLFDDGTNMYGSYAYAKKIKITIFNPAGEHGIYVYDVSLVKYEQIKGYQADVVIDNAARESGSSIDLTLSSGVYAPSAADVFMTGVALQPSGYDIISQWMVGGDQMREYLTAMSFDYSRAVALPKMKYTGVLNVPGSEPLLPTLFLRDGTFYFPKTYTYDLYADELNVELISISAADVSLSSVVISQTSEASATMGATTGSVGGGGIVSMPRDKEMSDTSDNAVENKVIKKYVDDLRDQLLDLWHLDENGNLVTDKQVLIKNSLIIEDDTSSGGEGQDTPSGGISGVKVNGTTYYDDNGDGIVDLGTISGGGGTADLSNYYTKAQSDARYLASSLLGSNTIIHSGNIGSYAPTYDASKNVTIDNQLWVKSYLNINRNGSTGALYDASRMGIEIEPFASYITFKGYKATGSVGSIILNSFGNVTIGASDLAGTSARLSVDGSFTMWGTYQNEMPTLGDFTNARFKLYGYGNRTTQNWGLFAAVMNSGDVYLQAGGDFGDTLAYDLLFNPLGGNVGIGTTSPAYKLDVNGEISVVDGIRIGGTNNAVAGLYRNGYITSEAKPKRLWLYNEDEIAIAGTYLTIYSSVNINGSITASAITCSSTYPLQLTAVGSGTYNKVVVEYSSSGLIIERARKTDSYSGEIIPLIISQRGGGAAVTFSGNDLIVAGDTSSGSDIRFKDVIKNKTLKIEHIAKAPLFTFKWNDRDDDSVHLGSSAQYWENIAPWLVKGEDFKTLDYSTLGVAMGISLAKKAVNHEERIKALEKENKALKEEMRRMQYGG